jgi:hypothetical protein
MMLKETGHTTCAQMMCTHIYTSAGLVVTGVGLTYLHMVCSRWAWSMLHTDHCPESTMPT